VLIPPNCYWVMKVEGIWHWGHPTAVSLFWNVVFNLLVLVGLNFVLKRLCPRYALTQAEFITIYVMITIASALVGHDSLQLGIPNLAHPIWFATPENHWEELFWSNLPTWLTVRDMRSLEDWYDGGSTLYTARHISAWAGPVLWWCAFIMALGLCMVCLSTLLRKQWTEHEKLGYPIITLPVAMTQDGGNREFFAPKLFWIGFGLAALLDLNNGLHAFFPVLPLLDVRHDRTHFLDFRGWQEPWHVLGRIGVPLYPFLCCLGYFLPLDLSLSIWVFFVVRKLNLVLARWLPLPYLPRMPYYNEQSFGGWFAIFAYAMWVGRRYFVGLLRQSVLGQLSRDGAGELVSHRGAFVGLVAGMAFLMWFCLHAGMTVWVVVAFFAIYWVLSIGITRVRAELGPPAHEMAGGMNSGTLITLVAGTRGTGARNISMFPMFWWMTGRGYRTHPMPCQLETFKMAELAGMRLNRLGLAMGLAFAVGGLTSFWTGISQTYAAGNNPMIGHNWGQWRQAATRLQVATGTDYAALAVLGTAFGFTWMMMALRMRFLWWPLHPAGYALTMNFGVEYFWSCLVIAWLVKLIVLRYGGYKTYAKTMPAVFGILLGEQLLGAFWSVLSVALKRPIYDFSPG